MSKKESQPKSPILWMVTPGKAIIELSWDECHQPYHKVYHLPNSNKQQGEQASQ